MAERIVLTLCYIHTTKYHSEIKRNEPLIYKMTWVQPETIMLSGGRQEGREGGRKPTCYIILVIQNSRKYNLISGNRKHNRGDSGMGMEVGTDSNMKKTFCGDGNICLS